jgi:hypothetical protein
MTEASATAPAAAKSRTDAAASRPKARIETPP